MKCSGAKRKSLLQTADGDIDKIKQADKILEACSLFSALNEQVVFIREEHIFCGNIPPHKLHTQ